MSEKYTDEQDKKLDKEITTAQDPDSMVTPEPIDLGDISADKRMEQEKKILDDMVGFMDKWEGWRRPMEKTWQHIYKLYFSSDTEQKVPTRSKIFVPMIFRIVEAAVPIIVNTIFSSDGFFDVVPTNPDDQDIADLIELLLDYQLAQTNFYPKFIDYTKQLLLYGTSYWKVYWKVKRQWVWERTPIRKPVSFFGIPAGNKIVGWEEEKSYKVVDRGPQADVIDVLDVFPDPDATNEQEGKGVFIRKYMSVDDVRELGSGKFPVYSNTKSDQLSKSNQGTNESYSSSRAVRFSTRGISSSMGNSKEVEIMEFWGKYDLDGDGIREEAYIVIGNRSVLLKATSNPFQHQKRPLVRTTLFPVPMEWYGIGLVEPVISQQHELNTLRRQRLDNVNQIINNMWLVKDTSDIDPDTLVTSPSGIIMTAEMDGIKELRPGDVTQSAYIEAQTLEKEMEDTTVTRAAQGNPESGRIGRTASGAKLLVSQSLEKFGTIIRLIEETSLKRVLRMFHQLNLQFIDDDEMLRDPGLYGHLFSSAMTPEMLRAEVRFKMVGVSEMVGNEAKINQIATFLGMFKDVMKPETVTLMMQKIWQLMGFSQRELEEIQGAPPSAVRSAAVAGATDVAASDPNQQAIINEIQANGASTLPSSLSQQRNIQ